MEVKYPYKFSKNATEDLRKLIVQKYIPFYKFEENEIRVVRILYGMRNYSNLL